MVSFPTTIYSMPPRPQTKAAKVKASKNGVDRHERWVVVDTIGFIPQETEPWFVYDDNTAPEFALCPPPRPVPSKVMHGLESGWFAAMATAVQCMAPRASRADQAQAR